MKEKKGYQIHRFSGKVRARSVERVANLGAVFRELFVPSLHPRLGCLSESD